MILCPGASGWCVVNDVVSRWWLVNVYTAKVTHINK